MLTDDALDPHADLRRQVHELKTRLNELETRVWMVMDAFYEHEHSELEAVLDGAGDAKDCDD